jgi:hypothetical protein
MEIALDSERKDKDRRTDTEVKGLRRRNRVLKAQPLSRSDLDGRTNAAKIFDRTVIEITNDLGGPDNITTIQRGLIEAYAGTAVRANEMNVRMLLGQEVSLADHALIVSSLVRVASRLGVERRARDITPPTLNEIARDLAADEECDDTK